MTAADCESFAERIEMRSTTLAGLVAVFCVMTFGCSNYDLDTPDAPANRKGFEQHLGFKPGKEISQVYFYADELGADVRYQLSFKCNKKVIDSIISRLSLVPASETFHGLAPRDDLPWWKPDSIKGRAHWVKEKKDTYYWDLWYSEDDQIAFYQEYSI